MFIALQLSASTTDQAQTRLLREHAEAIAGPISRLVDGAARPGVAANTNWRFEKGVLVECLLSRKLVGRRRWEEATGALHWGTVRTASFDVSVTPHWWIRAWASDAPLGSLREVNLGGLQLERGSAAEPWKARRVKPGSQLRLELKLLRAFAEASAACGRGRVVPQNSSDPELSEVLTLLPDSVVPPR